MPSPLLRRENKLKVLKHILENGKVTRGDLSNELELAQSTLSYIIDELNEENFLLIEEVKSKKGRPYQVLSVNPERFSVIGVKVGREEVHGVLFNASLNPIREHRVSILAPMRSNEGYTRALRETVENLFSENLLGIGICSSGLVRDQQVVVSHVMNVRNWNLRDVLKDFERVIVMNDADALCREVSQRIGSDFLLISYGIGIGASLFRNGRIEHLEMGHMIVSSEGKCYCGQTGCLEYHSSEYAVLKSYLGSEIDFEDFISNEEEKYRPFIEEVRKKARENFEAVRKHYEKAFRNLSVAVGDVLMSTGVSRVFLAGEGAVSEDIAKLLEKMVKERFNKEFVDDVEFHLASANWMLGAARAVVEKYLSDILK
ncbi:ArsR family transcriptional regulator [Thermotoga sp. RQ7]|uniref:ROK family transcriptional regulator n=1 Tax=Thermotoga sp. RQ7 TaxID=126738 RepID=UPI0005A31CD5|nr:ROK family transcriptional regulator [Thermotoga sp. RQ7]AJG40411.1 ArsR family transcriptional regulator [Thermotoga sp. RQ7]